MSFTVEIDVAEIEIDRAFFEKIDALLANVGLELEPAGGDGQQRSAGVLVRPGITSQEEKAFTWPDFDFVGEKEDLLSLVYEVRGKARPGDGLVFSVSYGKRGFADSLRLVGSDHCFCQWYEESSRDLVLRVLTFLDLLRCNYQIERAKCIEMEETGETWFLMRGDGWEVRPSLPMNKSGEKSLDILKAVLNQQGCHLEFDQKTGSLFYRSPNLRGAALVRNNIFDGSLLPDSPVDDEFYLVDEESETRYLAACWRAARGINDIVSEFGEPDHLLGPIVLPEGRALANQRAVKQQICYENQNRRFVLFFREYETGRTSVTLAGKRISLEKGH